MRLMACGSSHSLVPVGKRHSCLSNECESNFSDMVRFSFNDAILVMSVRANK